MNHLPGRHRARGRRGHPYRVRGFIKAQIARFDDLILGGAMVAAKPGGKVRTNGDCGPDPGCGARAYERVSALVLSLVVHHVLGLAGEEVQRDVGL